MALQPQPPRSAPPRAIPRRSLRGQGQGGTCTGLLRPIPPGKLARPGLTWPHNLPDLLTVAVRGPGPRLSLLRVRGPSLRTPAACARPPWLPWRCGPASRAQGRLLPEVGLPAAARSLEAGSRTLCAPTCPRASVRSLETPAPEREGWGERGRRGEQERGPQKGGGKDGERKRS
jgi:hypothetical protein